MMQQLVNQCSMIAQLDARMQMCHTNDQLKVHLHTRCMVHFCPRLSPRPSFWGQAYCAAKQPQWPHLCL